MDATATVTVKARTLSFGRGFIYPSLNNLEAHFSNSDTEYRTQFRDVLAKTLSCIENEYKTYSDGLDAGQYAEIRDRHIAAILEDVDAGEYFSDISKDTVDEFKKYFQPIAMAYVKFLYQEGAVRNRKPLDVQGNHWDTVTFHVAYGEQYENTVEPDIQLFMAGTPEPIMTLKFAEQNPEREIIQTVETQTITHTTQSQLPLSVIHGQPLTPRPLYITDPTLQSIPPQTSTLPLPTLVLQSTVPYMTTIVSPRGYPQQIISQWTGGQVVPQSITGYAPVTQISPTLPIYQVQDYSTNGVVNIQGYPSAVVVPQPQMPHTQMSYTQMPYTQQQLNPQLVYVPSGLGYQTMTIPQQNRGHQISTYPSNNLYIPHPVMSQPTPNYQLTNYPLTGYTQPQQYQQPTGY